MKTPNIPNLRSENHLITLNSFNTQICLNFYIFATRWCVQVSLSTLSTQHTSVISAVTLLETLFPPLVKPSSFVKVWLVFSVFSDIFLYPPACPYAAVRSSSQEIPSWKSSSCKPSEFINHSSAKASLLKNSWSTPLDP